MGEHRSKASGKTGRGSNEGRNTSLLRIGVLFLALVSFFTTANGMRSYIFTGGNGGVAFAASAAIQSILLALSMNLPKYLQGIWNSGREDHSEGQTVPEDHSIGEGFFGFLNRLPHNLSRLFLCGIAVALTIVTILCSSWFSYVYIADVIHKASWGTDSELLVQQTYRRELYDARDYAHAYRTYLEERIGEDILTLEKQAETISDLNSSVNVDWDVETANYLSGGGTAASYMAPVITAMDSAMAERASQESRDLAAAAISDARENIENRIGVVQINLDRIDANLENYNRQMASLTSRINAATEETDVASLNASLNRLAALISSETQRQIELQQENTELDRALLRLPLYESILGLSSSTSSIAIRTQLIEMQSEFFKPDPDNQALAEMAADIFDSLRSAATTAASGGTGQEQNSLSYTNLLVQMNRLIRNLTDYSGIKTTEANLDELIAALRDMLEASQDETENRTDGQGTSDTGEDSDKRDDNIWKKAWQSRLEALKAQISSMPVYSEEPTAANTQGSNEPAAAGAGESEQVNVLTDSQREILRDYDRSASSAALDEMIRRYISNHNAVYQGLIYLASPYRMLAIFALCLALSFDLSGFVFGVVMQGDAQRDENEDDPKGAPKDVLSRFVGEISGHAGGGSGGAEWSILEHLHQYRVLTGDFSHRENMYYYRVFRDGLAEQWLVKDVNSPVPYKQGIYLLEKVAEADQEEKGVERGISVSGTGREAHMPQEVRYSGQRGGPQDGVFEDCFLIYEDGSLYREGPGETKSFICSLEEYVPVHCYDPEKKENRTCPVKLLEPRKKLAAKIAVVALSKKGTRVSAIYVIRDCGQD